MRNQFVFDLNAEIIVDNFAGGGGASTGIERALGRHVDIAINHDREAIAMHEANHPQTKHYCEDVWKVDPLEAAAGRPVGLAWFSPDCKHFSKAKGAKPKSKKIRGLAWVMTRWAKLVRPRVMMLENVEEFLTWGPLLSDGSVCPRRKGKTFRSFVAQLTNLGYKVEWKELRASDYGTPTVRKRLFLIARCDGRPIVWPTQTHGAPSSVEVRKRARRPWRTAAECIDWSLPCPSIFERTKPLAPATMRRIAKGIHKFVLTSADPFIVKVNHTAGWYDQFRGQSIGEPLQTITGSHGYGIVSPTLIQTGYGERPGQAPRVPGLHKPLGTVVDGQKHALVASFLAKHFGGHETPGSSLARPVDTVTATDHHALVTAQVAAATSPSGRGRKRSASGEGNSGALVAANVVRHFGESIGSAAADPVGTITAGGMGKAGLVTSHLSKLYGTAIGAELSEPMPTVTSGGNHLAEVRAFLIKYYGDGGQLADCRDPLHTITAKERLGLVTIHGEDYVITDIGMRMLEPHELYRAQGFPSDYIIAPLVTVWRGKKRPKAVRRPLPKYAQVRMCGNSVCPPVSEVIVAANVPELCAWHPGEKPAVAVA